MKELAEGLSVDLLVELRGVPKKFVKGANLEDTEDGDDDNKAETESTFVKPPESKKSIVGMNPFKKRKIESVTKLDSGQEVASQAATIDSGSVENSTLKNLKSSEQYGEKILTQETADNISTVENASKQLRKEEKERKRRALDFDLGEVVRSETLPNFNKGKPSNHEDTEIVEIGSSDIPKKKKKKEKIVFNVDDSEPQELSIGAPQCSTVTSNMNFTKSQENLVSVASKPEPVDKGKTLPSFSKGKTSSHEDTDIAEVVEINSSDMPKKKKKKEKIVFNVDDSEPQESFNDSVVPQSSTVMSGMNFTKSQENLVSVAPKPEPVKKASGWSLKPIPSLKPITTPASIEKPKFPRIVFSSDSESTESPPKQLPSIGSRKPGKRKHKSQANDLERIILIQSAADLASSDEKKNAMSCLANSFTWGNIYHSYDFELKRNGSFNQVVCHLRIGDNRIRASGFGNSQEEAKLQCAAIFYSGRSQSNIFLKRHNMVAMESNYKASELKNADGTEVVEQPHGTLPLGDSLGSSNIGHKLLQKMGWSSGEGLGKDQKGRVEPVQAVANRGRTGFSSEISKESLKVGLSRESAKKLLTDYIESQSDEPIVFSSDFNNQERALIHQTAQMIKRTTGVNIKTTSYGKGDERKLTVSIAYSPEDIFQMATHVGQQFGKLEVVSMGFFG